MIAHLCPLWITGSWADTYNSTIRGKFRVSELPSVLKWYKSESAIGMTPWNRDRTYSSCGPRTGFIYRKLHSKCGNRFRWYLHSEPTALERH